MGSPRTRVITKITHSYSSSMTNKHLRIGTILLKCLLKNWSKLWMIIRCIVNVQHCIVVFSMVCLCRFRTWWHQSILVEKYLGLVEDYYCSLGEHHLKCSEPYTVERTSLVVQEMYDFSHQWTWDDYEHQWDFKVSLFINLSQYTLIKQSVYHAHVIYMHVYLYTCSAHVMITSNMCFTRYTHYAIGGLVWW